MSEPMYSSEYVDGCETMLRRFMLPLVQRDTTAQSFAKLASGIRGHYMSKAVLETALLDFQLRCEGVSLGSFLGQRKRECDPECRWEFNRASTIYSEWSRDI